MKSKRVNTRRGRIYMENIVGSTSPFKETDEYEAVALLWNNIQDIVCEN